MALFALASHGWTEPIERALAAAHNAGAIVITPRAGQSVEPTVARPQERWWRPLPWRTGAEVPSSPTTPIEAVFAASVD